MGFEAAPFKLPLDYVEIIGGLDSPGWIYFKKLFKEGFEAARKHSDSLISKPCPTGSDARNSADSGAAIVELMQKSETSRYHSTEMR